jgi:hypothetical protein
MSTELLQSGLNLASIFIYMQLARTFIYMQLSTTTNNNMLIHISTVFTQCAGSTTHRSVSFLLLHDKNRTLCVVGTVVAHTAKEKPA